MAAPTSTSQEREDLVENSWSGIHREGPVHGEEKERTSCSNVRRRWCTVRKMHTELILGDNFQRKAEAKVENEEDTEQEELGGDEEGQTRSKGKTPITCP